MYSSVQLPINAVKSFPEAQFVWKVRRHWRNELDEKIVDGQDGRLLISQSGDLYIVGVIGKDTGTYTCVASNSFVKKEIIFEFGLNVLEGASTTTAKPRSFTFSSLEVQRVGVSNPVNNCVFVSFRDC